MSAPVVVAYDQTPHSKRALAEAAREAASRGTDLRIVHAYTTDERLPMGPFTTVVPTPGFEQTSRHDAEEILEEVAAQTKDEYPALAIETRAVPGDAPRAILAEASTAALLVVGSRGRGGFSGLLLGSTSQRVLADAPCPVIVTHDTSFESKGQIMVGLDHDEPGAEVLEFAFDTAARRGTGLIAANVWSEPWTMSHSARLGDEDGVAYEQAHTDRLTELLDPWQRKHPDVAVVTRVYTAVSSGAAGGCLVEASKTVDLLIVGMRSETGHRHANRLGPVTHTALHHAFCPIAVVPSSGAS
ncbi:nucleotide-binding universal stress UspA family protein [Catenulispora sp. GP43]|uniref:universal stress protein n=1 Tax=Catenulispora sp. GP43 TaxID=3156263 RepID=UPI003517B2F4